MHPAKTHPPTLIASDFYLHPYGGIARDVYVSKEGFARFFNVPVTLVEMLQPNVKQFDVFEDDWTECLGYVIKDRRNRRFCRQTMRWVSSPSARLEYKIVIISKDHSTVGKRFRDAPYLRKEEPCSTTQQSQPWPVPLLRSVQ